MCKQTLIHLYINIDVNGIKEFEKCGKHSLFQSKHEIISYNY